MTEDISSDKRRHERRDTVIPIEYLVDRLTPDEAFEGVIADVSESGLCLLTACHLREGEKIDIKNNAHSPLRSASVRWIRNDSELYYKVGLEFV
jgi:PilZ domain